MSADRLAGVTRVLISVYFDAELPGGGNQYSIDMAREWLRAGCTVHVFSSTFHRRLGDLAPYADRKKLVIHPIVDVERIFLSHRFNPEVYQAAKKILAGLPVESIHIHNFHGLMGAIVAAVESGFVTLYTALDFGLVCMNSTLYDGTQVPCSGPAPEKCRACMLRLHRVPLSRQLASYLPRFVFKALGKDPGFHKQRGLLNAYHNDAPRHMETFLPLLPRFDGILTISPIMGKIIGQRGVPADKIHFHIQGIHPVRNEQGAGDGPMKLMFLGHMDTIKGFGVITAALSRIPADVNFQISLYGVDARRFVERQSPAVRRFLSVRPVLKGDEVEKDILAHDAVVIPSLWYENTPYAVIRTLAVGRPVVASNQAGISFLIRQGENGLLLPTGDATAWRNALIELARSPERLRAMRRHCHFEKTVSQHAEEVERVIASLPKRTLT